MKFNWGHGIAIFFSLFVCVMLTALVMSKKQSVDLVTEDYYAEELVYQDRINQTENSRIAGLEVKTKMEGDFLLVELPEIVKMKRGVLGSITLYRPSGSEMDVLQEFDSSNNGIVQIEKARLHPGTYILQMRLAMDGKDYYIEQNYVF